MRKTPVVLGVLSIVFGSLTAVCCLLAPLMLQFFRKMSELGVGAGQSDLQRAQLAAAMESFNLMQGYLLVSSVLLGAMSVALMVLGVGLYRRRRWARPAAMVWALVAMVMTLINAIYSIGWLQPAQRAGRHAIYAAHGIAPQFELDRPGSIVGTLIGVLFYLAFPTVLLALVGRRSAIRDFLPAR